MKRGAITLTIDSRLHDVALAGPAVRAICESIGLDPDGAADLELAVVEVLNNIVVHGHASKTGHPTRLDLSVLPDAVRISIRDSGRPIPDAVLAHATATSPDFDPDDFSSLPETGLGLMLIRNCVDELEYHTASDGNTMTLAKYRPGHHRPGR